MRYQLEIVLMLSPWELSMGTYIITFELLKNNQYKIALLAQLLSKSIHHAETSEIWQFDERAN